MVDYYKLPQVPDYERAHFLLDQETLSLEPNAAVTEIAMIHVSSGAVFEMKIDPGYYNDLYFSFNPATIEWHNKQQGKNYLESLAIQGKLPSDVAFELIKWMHEVAEGKQMALWTQGSDFDIPIFKNFLRRYNLEFPMRHDSVRDFRTLAKLFPEVEYKKGNHSALDDVIKMNVHLQKLLQFEIVHKQFFPPVGS